MGCKLSTGFVLFLNVPVFRAEDTGCPSDWYYKSWQSCTASDSPGTRKCKATAESWGCSGDITQLYCQEGDKASCAEIGASLSAEQPNGFGFMCPSLMLGTSEMLTAAKRDGYDGAYGVVTIDALSCGQCVEIANDDPATYPLAPKILAQIFNSVASSVDVYMAGGGLGANNGCSAVSGYSPMASMYEKYPTSANVEFVNHLKSIGYSDAAQQIDGAIQNQGGLRGGKTYADCVASGKSTSECQPQGNGCDGGDGMCITDPEVACPLAFKGKSDFVTKKAQESCKWVFNHDLHWNRPVSYTVVPCPAGLTMLTGLVPDAVEANLTGIKVQTTTTTMEDCSEPTCSRIPNVKGAWKRGFEAMYTCNLAGEPYLESTNPATNPCGGMPPTPCPGPTPTPAPTPFPSPSPPAPSPVGPCPGGSLDACMDLCPVATFAQCVKDCEASCRGTTLV